MATDKLVDFDHVTDYISREAAIDAVYGAFRVKDVDDVTSTIQGGRRRP